MPEKYDNIIRLSKLEEKENPLVYLGGFYDLILLYVHISYTIPSCLRSTYFTENTSFLLPTSA